MKRCFYCKEPIVAGDSVTAINNGNDLMHRNCALRGVIGSLAHVHKRCSCFVPGSTESDPPEMTLREAAEAAVAEWRRLASRELLKAGRN